MGTDSFISVKKSSSWFHLSIKRLLSAEVSEFQVAIHLGCHISTVRFWKTRFLHGESIHSKKAHGRVPIFNVEISQKIIGFFCQFKTLPGFARWTISASCYFFKENPQILGPKICISRSSIHRLLGAHALKPHRLRYFLHLSDPDFFTKMDHIIEVYRTIQRNLFCFDECTGLQILEQIAPATPPRKGHASLREAEYIRHGTGSIFSVLEVATGQVFTRCIPDHTSKTVVEVFKLHVQTVELQEQIHYICDNYGSHSTQEMCEAVAELAEVTLPTLTTVNGRRNWLGSTDKRIVFHFLPFHGSWLNLIENWFGTLQKQGLKGVSMRSKEEFVQTIGDFNKTWNQHFAHPYSWTYKGKELRGKTVRKFTYWIQEESSSMNGKFLGKQLDLMMNLVNKERALVSETDWKSLLEAIKTKEDYLNGIVKGIDEIDFIKTNAKDEKKRQLKINEKINKARSVLRGKIFSFRKSLAETLKSSQIAA